jgi:serine/threonine protein kinase
MAEQSSFNKLVGTTLGNYRLKTLIERDNIGPIFLALATTTNTLFRLRLLVLTAELTPEARIVYLGRFQQEASQVATLQHPHILPLVDYGNHEGKPYLVWPHHKEVQPLHALIRQYGPLDTLTASRYLDQIAAALEYAHQHAILHRNLTTHTIFLQPAPSPQSARLTVTEFGVLHMLELSYQGGQKEIPRLSVSSEGCAPEQLLGKPVDTSTDVYALGAVLYRLLTGQRVFVGKTREDVIEQILRAPVPPLSARRSGLPPSLDEIIARALAKDPAKRFRHPIELANVYHQLVAPQDTARPALAVAAPPAVEERLSAHPQPFVQPFVPPAQLVKPAQAARRRALYYIAAGGAAVVVVGAVGIYGTHLLLGSTSVSSPAASTPVTNTGGSTPTKQGPTPTKQGPTHTGTVIARTSDVPANSAKTFPLANQSNPGILVHLANSNTFVAFNSTCTHAGCAVSYNPQNKLLECPCHGAAFDPAKHAAVVQGPAPTPLASVPIRVNADGTITTG